MMTFTSTEKLTLLRGKYKVKISHLRYIKGAKKKDKPIRTAKECNYDREEISQLGGETVLKVLDKQTDNELARYISRCSRVDIFKKKIGILRTVSPAYYHFIESPQHEKEAIESLLVNQKYLK